MLSLIAVIGKNCELGKDNKVIWNIPTDLKRFRQITKGHPVIMGRKTYQSIGHPLPNRSNIVLSSDFSFSPEGVVVVRALDEALKLAKKLLGSEEIFIIGGGSVYAEAIDQADRLYLTIVDATADADTFFPDFAQFSKILSQESHESDGLRYTYLTLEKP